MALDAIEQLDVIAGEVKPAGADLQSLVYQTGVIYGVDFTENSKDTDGAAQEAIDYKNKILGIVQQLFQGNQNSVANVMRIIVVILGNTNVTYQQLEGATNNQWMDFISDQIDEAFEFFALVTPEEKAAYLALP